jgi:hypothetical protein
LKHDLHVNQNRVEEIREYLEERFGENEKDYPKFVIIDDKKVVPEKHEWFNRFVQTNHEIGLTNERANRVIEKFE